jgi:c(7)-type cytochrome triheme protein
MKMREWMLFLLVFFCASAVFAETFGVKKRSPRPEEYGNVIINNFSEKNDVAPVVFNHWLHRAEYTCRLCHVDLGFAMEAGGTGIREADIHNGLYCGACHNGKDSFRGEEKNSLGKVVRNCDRCHSYGKQVKFEKDFYKFTKGFPKARFGNRIDWLKAEQEGRIKLKDAIEGITIKRKKLKIPLDTEIEATVAEMPDIIFSHKKHAVWNGCELCHPEIFGVKKGSTKYDMQDIFDGRYCGACHGKVAFTNMDCQLCHSKSVL